MEKNNNNKSKKSKTIGWDEKKGIILLKKDKITKSNTVKKTPSDHLKEILKEEIYNMLTEEVTYKFPFKNHQFKIRFDVNANPTKKGLKIQFIPSGNLNQNPDEARQLINELQIFLNQKLGNIGMAADFDPDVPYQNVIGFTVKLGSISNMIVKKLGGDLLPSDNNHLTPPTDEKTEIN